MLILLATYNGEQYLPEMLESLLAQTFADWRLLVRDDLSKDGTPDILQRFRAAHPDKVADIIFDGENTGVTRSFERLMLSAREYDDDYFMFADQDDVWLPEKIAHAMLHMQENEQAMPGKPVLVCTDLTVVDKQLNSICTSMQQYAGIRPDLLQRHKLIACTNYVTGCTVIINRRALECALPFAPEAVYHDHWTALKTIANNGKIVYINKSDILYRQHGDNTCGAVAGVSGSEYIRHHIQQHKQINTYNAKLYRQAHAALGMTKTGFWLRKIYYFIVRLLSRQYPSQA